MTSIEFIATFLAKYPKSDRLSVGIEDLKEEYHSGIFKDDDFILLIRTLDHYRRLLQAVEQYELSLKTTPDIPLSKSVLQTIAIEKANKFAATTADPNSMEDYTAKFRMRLADLGYDELSKSIFSDIYSLD